MGSYAATAILLQRLTAVDERGTCTAHRDFFAVEKLNGWSRCRCVFALKMERTHGEKARERRRPPDRLKLPARRHDLAFELFGWVVLVLNGQSP
jgi:hypothetical protein